VRRETVSFFDERERKNMKKTVLCFGDSNTWGWIPGKNRQRFDETQRWPMLLQERLGNGYYVVEAGQNGRFTVWDDELEPEKCGLKHLVPTMQCAFPLDLVIIMLGTNDCRDRLRLSGYHIAMGAAAVAKKAIQPKFGRDGNPPKILLVCPPPIRPCYMQDEFARLTYGPGADLRAEEMRKYLPAMAEECGCAYLDAGSYVHTSDDDGVHMDQEAHRVLAGVMWMKTEELLR